MLEARQSSSQTPPTLSSSSCLSWRCRGDRSRCKWLHKSVFEKMIVIELENRDILGPPFQKPKWPVSVSATLKPIIQVAIKRQTFIFRVWLLPKTKTASPILYQCVHSTTLDRVCNVACLWSREWGLVFVESNYSNRDWTTGVQRDRSDISKRTLISTSHNSHLPTVEDILLMAEIRGNWRSRPLFNYL